MEGQLEAVENFRGDLGGVDNERGASSQKVRGKRYATGQISHKGVAVGKERKICVRKPRAIRVQWAMWEGLEGSPESESVYRKPLCAIY